MSTLKVYTARSQVILLVNFAVDLSLVFIAFILPAKIAIGLALRRAERKQPQRNWFGKVSRMTARMGILSVVTIYVVFVYVSQYTSWDGLLTWIQQHAILIPVPFLSGT